MTKFILFLVLSLFLLLLLFKPVYVCLYQFLKSKKHKLGLSFLISAIILVISYFAGDIALGFLIHFVVLFYIVDLIISVLNLPFRRKYNIKSKRWFSLFINILLITSSVFLTSYGYINFNNIQTTTYNLSFKGKTYPNTKIMFVSDIHISTDKADDIIKALNSTYNKEKPDIIIIGGDLLDNSSKKNDINNIIKAFANFTDKTPVLYVHGNHDVMTNSVINKAELENILLKNGIKVLKNKSLNIGEINYIGRFEKENKDIKSLISDDKDALNVVIDHRPRDLDVLNKQKIDLSLSGHTHAGQIFPIGYICDLFNINELQYGIKDFNPYKAIVSSGISCWGLNIKSQGKNEIVIVNIN